MCDVPDMADLSNCFCGNGTPTP